MRSIIVAIVFIIFAPHIEASKIEVDLSTDEYEVIIASVEYMRTGDWAGKQVFVIASHTAPPSKHYPPKSTCFRPKEASTEIIADFVDRNSLIGVFGASVKMPFEFELAEENDVMKLIRSKDGYQRFYDRYPKSFRFIVFSRPGFSNDRKQAIVYFSSYCALCGLETYILLTRENNKWNPVSECLVGMS